MHSINNMSEQCHSERSEESRFFTPLRSVQNDSGLKAKHIKGDYSLPGFEDRAAIERKSLNDLIGCLMGSNRQRFERELARGRHYDLFAVVVEASLADVSQGRYRSDMKP